MPKKILACASLLCLSIAGSNSAYAAPVWFNNLTLDTTYFYYDGYNDVFGVSWLENISSGCAITDSQKKSGYWANMGPPNSYAVGNARLAPAMMALGSGLKVDLLLDPANCNATYGAILLGVRVRKP